MTGVFDQQATCWAGVSEAGTGLTARWPPACPAHPWQRTAQAVTLYWRGTCSGPGVLTAGVWDWNLCPWGHRLARVSSQNSWGLHRASVNHALVSSTRNTGHTRITTLWLLRSSATFKHRVLPETVVILAGE